MAQLTWQIFPSALIKLGETYFRNQNSIPQSYKLLLCNGALSTSSSLIDILSNELTQSSGYERKSIAFNEYSLVGNSLSWTSDPVTFTPTEQSWQFTHAVLISDASAIANKTIESMSSATNEITVTAHGLSLNDKVFLTVSASAGIDLSRLYYVNPTGVNTFKLSLAASGSEVDLTTNNSGGGFLHYANGDLQLIAAYSELQTAYVAVPRNISVVWGVS